MNLKGLRADKQTSCQLCSCMAESPAHGPTVPWTLDLMKLCNSVSCHVGRLEIINLKWTILGWALTRLYRLMIGSAINQFLCPCPLLSLLYVIFVLMLFYSYTYTDNGKEIPQSTPLLAFCMSWDLSVMYPNASIFVKSAQSQGQGTITWTPVQIMQSGAVTLPWILREDWTVTSFFCWDCVNRKVFFFVVLVNELNKSNITSFTKMLLLQGFCIELKYVEQVLVTVVQPLQFKWMYLIPLICHTLFGFCLYIDVLSLT